MHGKKISISVKFPGISQEFLQEFGEGQIPGNSQTGRGFPVALIAVVKHIISILLGI